MQKTKKSILSIILICAILISSLAVSTVSVSAAASPKLNLVNPKSSGSFDVVWNIVPNAIKYRIYFGAVGNGDGWRRFTVLNAGSCTKHPNYPSFKFTINSSSLSGRKWYKYGQDQGTSTPKLELNWIYKCQVEALGNGDRHLAWTNVDYVCLGASMPSRETARGIYYYRKSPFFDDSRTDFYFKFSTFPYNTTVQLAYKTDPSDSSYTYKDLSYSNYGPDYDEYGPGYYFKTSLKSKPTLVYKVRSVIKYNGKIFAYSPWTTPSYVSGYLSGYVTDYDV